MTALPHIYRHSLTLLTDLYQLTMAYGYWKNGIAEREAVFHLVFRKCPFGGQFAIACGLSYVVDYLRSLRFSDEDCRYLASLAGADGEPLFEPAFLDYLRDMEFRCDVDAVSEGTVMFAYEPLLRVRGPLLQCQLIETSLLNMVNFQTLIATKAARVCQAARGKPVLEFGLRRAQGIDGGLAASRAAYVGGCAGTSNVLAGKLFDIPVKGTHAHSWVMAFGDEQQAFEAYADAMPNNCVFLVDTYDTIAGVKKAVKVGQDLRDRGHEMQGIRLDSGDLAGLSREARTVLDDGGFPDAAIVASSDLDEFELEELHRREARIDVWGIGTRLATAYDQPALGGVYKLSAMRDDGGQWDYRLKLSEQMVKTSDPGILQVRRFQDEEGKCIADAIYDEPTGIYQRPTLAPLDGRHEGSPVDAPRSHDLLFPVFRGGVSVHEPPSAPEAQSHTQNELNSLDGVVKRLGNPEPYPVGLEQRLHETKAKLIAAAEAASRS